MNRVGLGFDAHPLVDGRPLKLGGVEVPFGRGLAGHSDGDVVLHAVADALLGAAGLGSLGELFSDQDPANKGADSLRLLESVRRLVYEAGFRLVNVDAIVIAQEPRVAAFRVSMEARIAGALSVEEGRVSVRGTSSNGLGFAGKGEGIAAVAVVLLEK